MIQDEIPALYLSTVTFSWEGEEFTRLGIIACVRLEPFEKGVVLPHERTFSKVKSERLQLMKYCHANFSPIFSLYSDGDDDLAPLNALVKNSAPEVDVMDDKGQRHCLWPVTDKELIALVGSYFKHQIIYIADGHHRYETALDYRDWVKENDPSYDANHPANFIMMSLSSMEDPGMVVLPAHRLLKHVDTHELDRLAGNAQEYFDIQSFDVESELRRRLVAIQLGIGISIKTKRHWIFFS